MNQSITEYYNSNQLACADEISKNEKMVNRFSLFRLLWIFAGLALFYQSFKTGIPLVSELAFFGIALIFGLLVKQQTRFAKKKKYFEDLKKVNENELESIRSYKNIYPDGSENVDGSHPYSSDLDIFGKGSLYNLVNRCATSSGNAKLAGWLKKPAEITEIRQRQEAVNELSLKPKWKLNFQTLLLFSNQSAENHEEKLFSYMKVAPKQAPMWLKLYLDYIPFVFAALALTAFYFHILFLGLLVIGFFNLLLMYLYNSKVKKTDSLIGKIGVTLGLFSEAIESVKKEKWNSELGAQLASRFSDNGRGELSQQIRYFSVLINRFNLGLSEFGFVLNIIMSWNVRQYFAIEEWKKNNTANLQEAFEIIASFEALLSLSSLKTNYTDWYFPEIAEDEHYTLEAGSIAHPLIPETVRVANDFSLNKELKIDIITGSNMAGKSTFLRTLGINTVLALCGAPVCAEEMRLTPMLIFSYMRIADSLTESTSTFKAELDRLKFLLEILEKPGKVYFLIDEMLRGTNSVDKYLGSKAIIEKLIAQKAVGIVATHDLEIAKLEQSNPDYIRNFYFDIRVENDEMLFDYTIKPGECKTFNASMLLKKLGIFTQ